MLLLLLLGATQPARGSGWAEVGGTVASAAGTAEPAGTGGTRTTEPATRAARPRSTEATARTGTAKSAATAAGTARTRATVPTCRPWWPILAGARFADSQVSPHEWLGIEPLDDFFADAAIGELHERKAARSTGFAVDGHHDVRGFSDGSEVTAEACLGRTVRQVPDEQTN
jgi:hypothetical protein